MEREYFISLWLDTRRAKANGKFPVKLRVFIPSPRTQKLYLTKFEFTEKEFAEIWLSAKPKKVNRDMYDQMRSVEKFAEDIAKDLSPFTFEIFEKKLKTNKGEGVNVFYQYDQVIAKLQAADQIGTASNYELALKSLRNFLKYEKGREPSKILFTEITPDWLNKYQRYMVNDLKRSRTTVSIYLRTLRTVFNIAIAAREIKQEIYPFGKGKYSPPSVKKVKKAFNQETLAKLYRAEPLTQEQAKAKDFWFFIYFSSGINVKDIALSSWANVQDRKFIFYRAKTINVKGELRPIEVHLTDHALSVIEKYGNADRSPKNFIFDIISDSMSEADKHKKIKNFTRFINQNVKKLAVKNGITEDISTYWARHSFSTNAIRNGATMEMVGEALGHGDSKTTQGYFAGFESKTQKDISEKLESQLK